MEITRRRLDLMSAIVAIVFLPFVLVSLFALQGASTLQEGLLFLLIILLNVVSLVFIIIAGFAQLSQRTKKLFTFVVGVNVAVLVSLALLLLIGVVRGDFFIPLILSVPSVLFLVANMVKK